jgi:hypothetical protein
MSTQVATQAVGGSSVPVGNTTHSGQVEIKLYSHSPILYWWPVWAIGLLMAFLTYVDGGKLAYIPAGTTIEDNRLVIPADDKAWEAPHDHLARNPYLGTLFFLTILVVFVFSTVQLRGLWEWIGGGCEAKKMRENI